MRGEKLYDLKGLRFGRLTAIRYVGDSSWECICDCGKTHRAKTYNLRHGLIKSCGCLRDEKARQRATKHGGANDPLYFVLSCMHQRCENEKSFDYKWYGAKGVKVCPE